MLQHRPVGCQLIQRCQGPPRQDRARDHRTGRQRALKGQPCTKAQHGGLKHQPQRPPQCLRAQSCGACLPEMPFRNVPPRLPLAAQMPRRRWHRLRFPRLNQKPAGAYLGLCGPAPRAFRQQMGTAGGKDQQQRPPSANHPSSGWNTNSRPKKTGDHERSSTAKTAGDTSVA